MRAVSHRKHVALVLFSPILNCGGVCTGLHESKSLPVLTICAPGELLVVAMLFCEMTGNT